MPDGRPQWTLINANGNVTIVRARPMTKGKTAQTVKLTASSGGLSLSYRTSSRIDIGKAQKMLPKTIASGIR